MLTREMKNKSLIWITWEHHRRTKELCKDFKIKVYIFESKLPRILKHPINLLRTFKTIKRTNARILFIQNPSIVLGFFACFMRNYFKYKLVVDAHNGAIVPELIFLSRINVLYKFVQRKSDITVVTNNGLSEIVEKNGGNPYILPDKIPEDLKYRKIKLAGTHNLVYICTFASDEPYFEVISAAKKIDKKIKIYITGNYKNMKLNIIKNIPENVILTGYLQDEDYWNILYSADASIDLTTRENCLVCGAYESVAVGTPMILTDTKVLKSYFYKGAVYCKNNRLDIFNAINQAIQSKNKLKKEVRELKIEVNKSWNKRAKKFLSIINSNSWH